MTAPVRRSPKLYNRSIHQHSEFRGKIKLEFKLIPATFRLRFAIILSSSAISSSSGFLIALPAAGTLEPNLQLASSFSNCSNHACPSARREKGFGTVDPLKLWKSACSCAGWRRLSNLDFDTDEHTVISGPLHRRTERVRQIISRSFFSPPAITV